MLAEIAPAAFRGGTMELLLVGLLIIVVVAITSEMEK